MLKNAQEKFEKLLSETEKKMKNLSRKISEARTDLKAEKRKTEADINHQSTLVGAGTSALSIVGTAAACFLTFSNPFGIAAAVVAGASALGTGATAVNNSRSKDKLNIDHGRNLKALTDIEVALTQEFDKMESGRDSLKSQIKEIFMAQEELANHLNRQAREVPIELFEQLEKFSSDRFMSEYDGFVNM